MTVKVLSSVQKSGFSGQNLLWVTSPVSKVLKWLVHCLDIFGPLWISTTKTKPVLPISRFQNSRPGVLNLFCAMHPSENLVQPTYGPLIRKMHFKA